MENRSHDLYQDGALVILHRGDKILLQLRTDDAPVFPSCWGAFGGQVEENETPESAAVREISEEIGVQLREDELIRLGVINALRGTGSVKIFCFTAPFTGELIDIRLAEGHGFGLIQQREIHNLRMTPESRQAVERHFANQGFTWE